MTIETNALNLYRYAIRDIKWKTYMSWRDKNMVLEIFKDTINKVKHLKYVFLEDRTKWIIEKIDLSKYKKEEKEEKTKEMYS